jgi:hypothetical protein
MMIDKYPLGVYYKGGNGYPAGVYEGRILP